MMQRWRRLAPAMLAVLTLMVLALASHTISTADGFESHDPNEIHADEAVIGLDTWTGAIDGQVPGVRTTCDKVQPQITKGGFTDPVLVLTDAHLVPGSNGQRLCVFQDNLSGYYAVWPINLRSLDEFSQMKSEFMPLLVEAGVDPCRIAYWAPPSKTSDLNLFHDVGQVCEAIFVAHGRTDGRIADFQRLLGISAAKGEEVFGRSLTWPLVVHLYDTHDAFAEGVRVDGGDITPPSLLKEVAGMVITSSNRITVMLLDASAYSEEGDLLTLVAHEYAHVLQQMVAGCSCSMPLFAKEGGAEYFASLVTGPEQRALAIRFQNAVDDERAGKATPLTQLVMYGFGATPYRRGYAAARFMTSRWGAESFAQLWIDNFAGTPDAYLQRMSRLTGLTLDEFDREMNAYLRTFPTNYRAPTPIVPPRPAATPARPPGSP